LKKTAQKTGAAQDKKLIFDYSGIDPQKIPSKFYNIIKDILIQLVRNSVTHGIETPKVREQMGKSPVGKIILSSNNKLRSSDRYELTLRDDGRGLDIDELKMKAVEMNHVSKEEIDTWDDKKIVELIYVSGVSTVQKATMNAGRGVGMDIIKSNVEKQGGKIEISFKRNKFCEFKISLPI